MLAQEDGEALWEQFWASVHAPPPNVTLNPATVAETAPQSDGGFLSFLGAAQSR